RAPISPLFPYTPLFRSRPLRCLVLFCLPFLVHLNVQTYRVVESIHARLASARLETERLAYVLRWTVENHAIVALSTFHQFDLTRSEEHTSELQSRFYLV